jgi:hypothetical protein
MTYSPALAHFVDALAAADEFPSDRPLVAITRMLAAIEPIVLGPLSRDLVSDPYSTLEYSEPIHMVVQQARKDVDAIVEACDESVSRQSGLLCASARRVSRL